ncbi:MAG: hypothetical protein P1U74_03105 [Legionellaceae bacterium]|nr:hypothetical protein [Legionellaceae bacterium]
MNELYEGLISNSDSPISSPTRSSPTRSIPIRIAGTEHLPDIFKLYTKSFEKKWSLDNDDFAQFHYFVGKEDPLHAMYLAGEMSDQFEGAKLIMHLLKFKDEMRIPFNADYDLDKERPLLLVFARRGRWHAFYALKMFGPDETKTDKYGRTANDYLAKDIRKVIGDIEGSKEGRERHDCIKREVWDERFAPALLYTGLK